MIEFQVMMLLEVMTFDPLIAGIFEDTFGKLFSVIWDAIVWVGENIASFFQWLGGLIWDAITWLAGILWEVILWIGDLLGRLFSALMDLLMAFFEVIYALIDGLLYFLYQIGVIAVKVFLIFFELAKLIWAFIVGLGQTLASFRYNPRGSGGHGYSEMIGQIFTAAQPLQLDVVAYCLLTVIWVFTAMQAIKLLSNIRVGGD